MISLFFVLGGGGGGGVLQLKVHHQSLILSRSPAVLGKGERDNGAEASHSPMNKKILLGIQVYIDWLLNAIWNRALKSILIKTLVSHKCCWTKY